MAEPGVTVRLGSGGARVELRCPHQGGQLYAVPAEASWVCSEGLLHAHALAGFFKELVKLDDPRVRALMQRWGVYFRELPVEEQGEGGPGTPHGG